MATAADMLRMIAQTQLERYLQIALEILKTSESLDIKSWVQQTGLAKIELALCEAYMEVLTARHKKLEEEVRRHQRPRVQARQRRTR